MREQSIILMVLATVTLILPSPRTCLAVAEVGWNGGLGPDYWIIWPTESTTEDIINFSGPTMCGGDNCCFGDHCKAERYYGGIPAITIDHENRTIELWFEPPPPPNDVYCIQVGVCGLDGQFGPLEQGEWLFFSDTGRDIRFNIEFSVTPPPIIELENPNGGESFVAGSRHIVSWRDLRFEGFCPSTYNLQYSTDNGHNWTTQMTIPGRCSTLWTVPDVNSDECLIRIYDTSEPDNPDQSDQTFTIYQCTQSFAADYNLDCYVNGYDYALFAWWWGFEMADMNDLAELADSWLLCSNPYDPLCTQ
ncbi:MAG: hypothetical protein ACYSWP_14570 [Planctomycetota bacterium]|jgi:hypothetical protein